MSLSSLVTTNLPVLITFGGEFVSMDTNPHWSALGALVHPVVWSTKCFVSAAVCVLIWSSLWPALSAGSLSMCRIGHINEL